MGYCLAAGEAPDYSSDRVRSSIKESLERLGVDYIDVLHCHDIEFCPDMRQVRSISEACTSITAAASGNASQSMKAPHSPMGMPGDSTAQPTGHPPAERAPPGGTHSTLKQTVNTVLPANSADCLAG